MNIQSYLKDVKAKKVPACVMGIVNLTPDSFSHDGVYQNGMGNHEPLLEIIQTRIDEGAKIIDLGGQSTRPGHTPISLEEEWQRLAPALYLIPKLKGEFFISVDSSNPETLEKALDMGCHIINDVLGGQNRRNLELAQKYQVPIILMHNQANIYAAKIDPVTQIPSYSAPIYEDFIHNLYDDLKLMAQNALNAGLLPDQIILDAGAGFGKNINQNLDLVKYTPKFLELGFPILLGVSRKSFISTVVESPNMEDRIAGSHAAHLLAVEYGASIIRTHDVRTSVNMLKVRHAVHYGLGKKENLIPINPIARKI